MDQYRSSVPENQKPFRSGNNSNQTAKNDIEKKLHFKGQVDIIAMVRSLQRTAGVADCFKMGNADCDIIDCDWRTYCLSTPADTTKIEKPAKLK